MTTNANPILFQLSADCTRREAHRLFKSGQIDAAAYNRILADCRVLEMQARQQMAVLVPHRRELGTSFDERRF